MVSRYVSAKQLEEYRNMNYVFTQHSLEQKVVLVPGGSGGLGAALVALLLKEKALPVLGYRSNSQRALRVKNQLESLFGGQVHLVEGDINERADRNEYIKQAAQINGNIYGLACFVGDPARTPFEMLQSEDLLNSYRQNFAGPILLAKQVAEHMIRQEVEGSLVLLSSMQGVGLFEQSLNYAAPKASLVHACRILAKHWSGRHNIRINVVAPGATIAGMAESSVSSGKYDKYIEKQAVRRFGRPEDIARCVRFLLEPDNYVTGQVITVDGGMSLKS